MTQTPQQIADYLATCRRIQELYSYNYANTELEDLMLCPHWKTIACE
ncbi:hypothetical protein COO91_10363 (plasmid) [Nostoc flagelliforme CCNUN1]|uniref:Uncharacterized protein n=1 Tax=Nostoc flagelliforme CCNUN1 TaxID=2038116 RepID=A0A2K8T977_9NOSO|nr:hypothetical protein [Nostoc flagelliforme]AUB44143.1 hypothetical protein COO91_10363 [Nostoc flagelliforme CCNUN1]